MDDRTDEAKWLEARGWTKCEHGYRTWLDPLHPLAARLYASEALTIQRARDAAEERKAWVRFAAAALPCSDDPGAAQVADDMLAEFRRRFGAGGGSR